MSEEQNKFEKRKQEAQKRKRKLQKMQNSKIKPRTKHVLAVVGGALAAIIVVIALVFANAGFTRRMVTALEIGNEKVSSAEYSYYYIQQAISTYNTYVQMLGSSYAPFDTGKSLDRQAYSDTQSWADYLSDSAISALRGIKTLVQAANEEGFTIFGEKWKCMKARKASDSAGYKIQKMFTIKKGEKREISSSFLIIYMG